MSRVNSIVSVSYLWLSFCIGVCAMIPSYNIHSQCNSIIDMKKEGIHLGQVGFSMALDGAITEIDKTCTITIEPWLSKPNIQYYFSELSLPLCANSRLEIMKSSDGSVYSYPADFKGAKCGNATTKPLIDKVHTVTGSYLRLKFTWSKRASRMTSFKMVFNSYGTGSCLSEDDHLCNNKRCIVKNITCDNYNTCGDQSDCSDGLDEEMKMVLKIAIILFAIIAGAIFICVTCCVVVKMCKECMCCSEECCSDCCECIGRLCSGCCSFIGRKSMTSFRFCGSACSALYWRCGDYYRGKCGENESSDSQEEEVQETNTQNYEQTEPVDDLHIRLTSISEPNEHGDESYEPEVGGATNINMDDPPPPYRDEFRREVPSAPPRENSEELPPPKYDEVVGQPSKYNMKVRKTHETDV